MSACIARSTYNLEQIFYAPEEEQKKSVEGRR
jgi:hypothetical protein